jgi:tetratricopeptide (TPR) repeat protein
MGDTEKALEYYRRALELNPGGVTILNGMGRYLSFAGRYHDAASIALKALEQAPGIADSWKYDSYNILGSTLPFLGRADEYLSILQSAAAKYGRDNPCFYVYLGEEYCKRGDFAEAISLFERALEIREDEDAFLGLAGAQWLAGDTDAAMSSYIRAEPIATQPHTELRIFALLQYLGRFAEIEQRLEAAKAQGKIETWFWRSTFYYASMRRFNDAIALAKEMAESPSIPWKYDILWRMVEWHRMNGDLAETLRVIEEAKANLPPPYHPSLDYQRGLIAVVKGLPEHAEECARDAIEAEAADYRQDPYLGFLARLQFAGGSIDEALSTLAGVTGVSGRSSRSGFYLRAQLKQVSQAPDAEDELRKLLFHVTRRAYSPMAWAPDLAGARSYCALAAARLGDRQRARDEAAYALRLEPESAEIAYVVACTHSLCGHTDQALDWLETAVERGHQDLWWARVDPDLDALRDLPRFNQIMADWDQRLQALD